MAVHSLDEVLNQQTIKYDHERFVSLIEGKHFIWMWLNLVCVNVTVHSSSLYSWNSSCEALLIEAVKWL